MLGQTRAMNPTHPISQLDLIAFDEYAEQPKSTATGFFNYTNWKKNPPKKAKSCLKSTTATQPRTGTRETGTESRKKLQAKDEDLTVQEAGEGGGEEELIRAGPRHSVESGVT